MLRKLALALATAVSLTACNATTGPDLYQYNADGESEASHADGSSFAPEPAGGAAIPVTNELGSET
jgi:hypothetical protein